MHLELITWPQLQSQAPSAVRYPPAMKTLTLLLTSIAISSRSTFLGSGPLGTCKMLSAPAWMQKERSKPVEKRPASEAGEEDEFQSRSNSPKHPRYGDQKDYVQTRRTADHQSSSRRHGQGGSGSSHLDPLEKLALQTAELSLETAAGNRELRGFLEHTILAAQDHPIPVGALEGAQEWEKEKQAKRGQNIGSSHVAVGISSLMAFSSSEEFSKEENKDFKLAVNTFWEEVVQKLEREDLAAHICVFRAFKPKIPSKQMVDKMGAYTRLVVRFKPATRLSMHAADLEEQLLLFCKRKGWKVQSGTPPAAKKERGVRDALAGFRR